MNYFFLVAIVLLSSIITIWSIPLVVKIARRKNLVDEPGSRKSHHHPIPTIGGVSIFLSLVSALFLINFHYPIMEYASLQFAMIIVLFTGLKDDILVSSPMSKLLMQFVAFFILIYFSDLRISSMHGIFGIEELPYIASVILTLFVAFALINSFNLIDGIDGLASGIAFIVSISFGFWFLYLKEINYSLLSFSLAASTASFFYFNVFGKHKKMFMGDTGSMIVGFLLSLLVIKFTELSTSVESMCCISAPGIAFGLMAIPLLDSVKVFVIRLIEKRSPFKPDKIHLHHDLLNLGLSHLQVTLIVMLVNIVMIAVVSYLNSLNNLTLIGIVVLMGLLFLAIVYVLKKRSK